MTRRNDAHFCQRLARLASRVNDLFRCHLPQLGEALRTNALNTADKTRQLAGVAQFSYDVCAAYKFLIYI